MSFEAKEVIKNQKHVKIIKDWQKSSNSQITLWASWPDSNIVCLIHLVLKGHEENYRIVIPCGSSWETNEKIHRSVEGQRDVPRSITNSSFNFPVNWGKPWQHSQASIKNQRLCLWIVSSKYQNMCCSLSSLPFPNFIFMIKWPKDSMWKNLVGSNTPCFTTQMHTRLKSGDKFFVTWSHLQDPTGPH